MDSWLRAHPLEPGNDRFSEPSHVFEIGLPARMRRLDHGPGDAHRGQFRERLQILLRALGGVIFEPVARADYDIEISALTLGGPHVAQLPDLFAQLLDGMDARFLIGLGHRRGREERGPAVTPTRRAFDCLRTPPTDPDGWLLVRYRARLIARRVEVAALL